MSHGIIKEILRNFFRKGEPTTFSENAKHVNPFKPQPIYIRVRPIYFHLKIHPILFDTIMYKAESSVVLFKILGLWPENTTGFLTIYNLYTVFIASIILGFLVSTLVDTLNEDFETDAYKENFFYFAATVTSCLKMIVIYWKHSKIREIMLRLDGKRFEPRDTVEFYIQNKFDKIGRFIF